MAWPAGSLSAVVINIQPGTYKELIYVQRENNGFSIHWRRRYKHSVTYDVYASLPGPQAIPLAISALLRRP